MSSRLITLSVMIILVGVASAEKTGAPNKDKIIGTWEFAQREGVAEVTYTFGFVKDGTIKGTAKMEGETMSFKGTWEVEGDTLTMRNAPGTQGPFLAKGSVLKIKTLTDKWVSANRSRTVLCQ